MSYQSEREDFITRLVTEGDVGDRILARQLMRRATTLHRLSEAQCNGDWPADNGERKVIPCPLCESCWVPSAITGGAFAVRAWNRKTAAQGPSYCAERQGRMRCNGGTEPCRHEARRRACPDCRTTEAVETLLDGTRWQPYFQVDPRGWPLELHPRGTSYEDMHSGRSRGIGVPVR